MKFLTIILTIVLALTMVACDNTPKPTDLETQSGNQTVSSPQTENNEEIDPAVTKEIAEDLSKEASISLLEFLYGTIAKDKYQNEAMKVSAVWDGELRLSDDAFKFESFMDIGITDETSVKQAKKLIDEAFLADKQLPVAKFSYNESNLMIYICRFKEQKTLDSFLAEYFANPADLDIKNWASNDNNGKVVDISGGESLNKLFIVQSDKAFISAVIETEDETAYAVFEDFLKTLKF